jgi:hypothetical protein
VNDSPGHTASVFVLFWMNQFLLARTCKEPGQLEGMLCPLLPHRMQCVLFVFVLFSSPMHAFALLREFVSFVDNPTQIPWSSTSQRLDWEGGERTIVQRDDSPGTKQHTLQYTAQKRRPELVGWWGVFSEELDSLYL